MSYDPRFDRYRSPNFKRPKSSVDRTLWGKQTKPRGDAEATRQPRPPQSRLKRSKFRLWAVWAVLMLGGLGLAVNLFYLQVTRAPALRKQAQQQQTLKSKPFEIGRAHV